MASRIALISCFGVGPSWLVPGSAAVHLSSTRSARSTVVFSTPIPITRPAAPSCGAHPKAAHARLPRVQLTIRLVARIGVDKGDDFRVPWPGLCRARSCLPPTRPPPGSPPASVPGSWPPNRGRHAAGMAISTPSANALFTLRGAERAPLLSGEHGRIGHGAQTGRLGSHRGSFL